MGKGRLEAFSDGVIAIIITIMVLEMKVPAHAEHFGDLLPLVPVFLSYVLSFVYVGIYWNNHHHLLHATKRITGRVLWSNLLLLFWLSLVPFVTGWMGENHFAPAPTSLYGVVLLCSAIAYINLQHTILKCNPEDSDVAVALAGDWKGPLSAVFYIVAIGAAFWNLWVSWALYVAVALLWLVPDRRIERRVQHE